MKQYINDGAEFLLMHHVYKSDNHHWQETYPFFTKLHFPMYYFYDILHALRVLTKLGYGDDDRIWRATGIAMATSSIPAAKAEKRQWRLKRSENPASGSL